jgi:hypothetical protein
MVADGGTWGWSSLIFCGLGTVTFAVTLAPGAASLAGHNTALPDRYGLSAVELARVMTRWRERALALPPRV